MAEKRKFQRTPCSDKVMIRQCGKPQSDIVVPVYLRDFSEGGISGTLFGENPFTPDEPVIVDYGSRGSKSARIAWGLQSIHAVHMVGFEFVDELLLF